MMAKKKNQLCATPPNAIVLKFFKEDHVIKRFTEI